MCYYERPNMVRFALESIRRQNYSNWELCFVDDTETGSGEQSVKDILGEQIKENSLKFLLLLVEEPLLKVR